MKRYDEGGLLGTLFLAMVGIQAIKHSQQNQTKNPVKQQNKKQPEHKNIPVMQVGKIYELMNGKRACCFKKKEKEFLSVLLGDGITIWHDEYGKCTDCLFTDKLEQFNVRRTWKKKYDKQK